MIKTSNPMLGGGVNNNGLERKYEMKAEIKARIVLTVVILISAGAINTVFHTTYSSGMSSRQAVSQLEDSQNSFESMQLIEYGKSKFTIAESLVVLGMLIVVWSRNERKEK